MSGSWPWPGDNPLVRARKVAAAYRAALRTNNRELCDGIDQAMAAVGETWPVDPQVLVDRDGLDEVTTAEAAELVHVPTYEILRWACTPHPDGSGRALLPKFGKDGRANTYLVRDVVAAARLRGGSVGLPTLDT